ncbi:MAG: LysR family transcriptional regulator, partial [Pseudonocardiales bacterium]
MRSKESAGLRYFHEVARTGSVTRAGANLFVAASAVSRQIRLLEDELGVQLFTRGSRGMTLTTAGHQVFAFAADAEQRASDLRSELNSDRYAVRGHVNVATVEGLLMRYVPVAIERLARTHADIRLCIRADGSQDVGTAVAEGSAQLGFVFGHPARPDLIALKSLPLPLSVMVRPGCSLATRASCTLR